MYVTLASGKGVKMGQVGILQIVIILVCLLITYGAFKGARWIVRRYSWLTLLSFNLGIAAIIAAALFVISDFATIFLGGKPQLWNTFATSWSALFLLVAIGFGIADGLRARKKRKPQNQ